MPIVNAKMSPDGKKKKLVWNDNGTMKLEDTSSGGLPSVSVSDDGKLLGVSSGEWTAVNPPSGSFIIRLTWDDVTYVGTLDKTWQEIKDAVDSNNIPLVITDAEGEGFSDIEFCYLSFIGHSASEDWYDVKVVVPYYISDQDQVTFTGYDFTASSPSGYPQNIPGASE